MINKTVSLTEKHRMSQGIDKSFDIEQILLECIPFATGVEKASFTDDLHYGIDYWVLLESGHRLGIDIKVRERGNDLPLETWSIIGSKIGWTRNPNKRTDYIVWIWINTGRFMSIPFLPLCKAFTDKWQQWRTIYPKDQQTTNENGRTWKSECIFVPSKAVWNAVYDASCGHTTHAPRQVDLNPPPSDGMEPAKQRKPTVQQWSSKPVEVE